MPNSIKSHTYLLFFQSNLEIEVPNYYAENDPLLTYSTPLHSMEEHTTTREELIGKQNDGDGGRRPSADSSTSNGSNESDVKSWALDHAYVPNEIGKKFNLVMETGFLKMGFRILEVHISVVFF